MHEDCVFNLLGQFHAFRTLCGRQYVCIACIHSAAIAPRCQCNQACFLCGPQPMRSVKAESLRAQSTQTTTRLALTRSSPHVLLAACWGRCMQLCLGA